MTHRPTLTTSALAQIYVHTWLDACINESFLANLQDYFDLHFIASYMPNYRDNYVVWRLATLFEYACV